MPLPAQNCNDLMVLRVSVIYLICFPPQKMVCLMSCACYLDLGEEASTDRTPPGSFWAAETHPAVGWRATQHHPHKPLPFTACGCPQATWKANFFHQLNSWRCFLPPSNLSCSSVAAVNDKMEQLLCGQGARFLQRCSERVDDVG